MSIVSRQNGSLREFLEVGKYALLSTDVWFLIGTHLLRRVVLLVDDMPFIPELFE